MSVLILLVLVAQAITPAPPRPAAAGTVVEARLESDGALAVDLYTDLDALLLGVSAATPATQRLAAMEILRAAGAEAQAAATERLTDYLRRRIRVRFDGVAAELDVEYPERRSTGAGAKDLATLGSFARLRAKVPGTANRFTFFASRSFRFIDLRAAIGERRSRQMVEPGAESEPIALR